jgi:PKD repeat protein
MKAKYFKHILLGALFISQIKGVMAQGEPCGTTQHMNALYAAHPEMLQEAIENEKALQERIAEMKNSRTADDTTTVYYVPVVFHVLHTNGVENIPDAQIFNEMVNLNINYRKLNSSTSSIVGGFGAIASDIKIEFRLATIDPNGNCTNGIERIYTHLTNNADDNSKIHPWPHDKYLNVWVVKTLAQGGGVLAYATFPSSNIYQIPYEGVIIKSGYVGINGQYSSTLTHEIGHYLNLSHTWGNTANGTACGDDGVEDTPITKGHQNACSNADLFTPVCTVNNTSSPYTFSKVIPTSGVTDTTAAPVQLSAGANFGKFTAVSVSSNSSDSSRFSFSNWDLGGAAINNDTTYSLLTGSINTSKYYEVTITPNARYDATLTGINFTFQRNATGVRSYAVRSSVDGYTNNLTASAVNDSLLKIKGTNAFFSRYDTTNALSGSTITLSGSSYTNFLSPITFRFYGWNAEDAAGTFSIDNVSFVGTVGAIENLQNYMDYTWCLPSQSMFTVGQRDRMRAALTNYVDQRDNLHRGSNLIATGTNNNNNICPPTPNFYANRYNICSGGTVTFTSTMSNGTPVGNTKWFFPGGTPSAWSSGGNPLITYNTPGTYDVKAIASNAAGTDSVTKTAIIRVSGGADYYGLQSENFEVVSKFWAWQINDWDNNIPKTWLYSTAAGYNSSKSIIMGANGNYEGDIDDLISPSFDLSNVTGASLTFRCAAASKAFVALDMNDVLTIYSSNNCGQTWSSRAVYTGASPVGTTSLALINNGFHSENFVPTTASQWALLTVPIPAGIATANVRFKFEYKTGAASNNIYIDDVNIIGTVGINENSLDNSNVSIYPNPTNQASTVYYHLNNKANVKISIVDMLGKTISETNNDAQAAGDHSFLVSKQDLNLKNGIYFIRFSVDNNTITQKLVFTE